MRHIGGTASVSWFLPSGILAQLEGSADLETWEPSGAAVTGFGGPVSVPVDSAGGFRFFRLRSLGSQDGEGDGLNDYEESLVGTDPRIADTDGDGDSDGREVLALRSDPLVGVQAPVIGTYPAAVSTIGASITGSAVPGETVTVTGGRSDVSAVVGAAGTFTLAVPLQPDQRNRLVFSARNAAGQTGPVRSIEIVHDSRPPDVHIDFPGNNAQLYTAAATIAGRVGDALSGYEGLDVTVNGQAAAVVVGIGTNGTFERASVPLALGENRIEVTAADVLGNSATKSILVYRADPAGSGSIAAVAGGVWNDNYN